jgi:hypothetical protein
MNRIIFQIGMLSFCISTVALGIQGEGLMQTIARSFLVLIGVVLALTISFMIASSVLRRRPAQEAAAEVATGPHAAEKGGRDKSQAHKA